MKWVVLALALAACDKLLSFSTVTYVAPDAAPDLVTGDDRYVVVGLGSDGLPAASETPPAADTVLEAWLPDGTALPLGRSPDGSFSFALASGASYRFAVRDSDLSIATEAQTNVRSIAVRRRFFSRPDAVYATVPTPVTYYESIATAARGDYVALAATGVRAYTTSSNLPSDTIDWEMTGYGLVSAAKSDRMYWEHFSEQGPLQYYTITETDQPTVEMQDGAQTKIGDALAFDHPVSLAADRCVHLMVPAATELSRLITRTQFTTNPAVYWDIFSMPVPAVGVGGGLPVVLASQPLTTDTEFDVAYGSPYVGERDVSIVQIYGERSLQLPARDPLLIEDIEQLYDLIPQGSTCATTVAVDTTPVALLDQAFLARIELQTDSQVITIDRSQPVPFEYQLAAGASDYVTVTLFEVIAVGDQPGLTATVPIRRYLAASPALIDPALFVRSHYYIFTVTVTTGWPGGGQVDFRTATLPTASSQIYTTMFRVAN